MIRKIKEDITLYHGGTDFILEPILNRNSHSVDFGSGFYCTTNEEQAKEWGFKKASLGQDGKKVFTVNEYMIPKGFECNIKLFENPNAEWFEFVYKGRNNEKLNFDIIIGPVADDTLSYLLGHSTKEINQLSTNVTKENYNKNKYAVFEKYAKLAMSKKFENYNQFVFISEKAIKALIFHSVTVYRGLGKTTGFEIINKITAENIKELDTPNTKGRIR